MQILHPFSGSVQQYLEQLSDPGQFRPAHCPQCQAKQPLIAHGFYTRTIADATFDGSISVRRYLCDTCRRTVSLLPEFALPYLRSSIALIALFLIARLLDAIWSPLVGHVSDHLGSTRLGRRFGRRRLILLFAIPFLPSFAFMWVSGHTYLYYLCTYVFFELVYASVLVPYGTLAPEMTDDFKKLSLFAGVRMLFAQISAILAGILPRLIIDTVGGKDSPDTFLYMGIIFSVLFMVVVFITYAFSWEREGAAEAAVAGAKKTSFFGIFAKLFYNVSSTMRIRAFRLHLGMYLGGYISQDRIRNDGPGRGRKKRVLKRARL